MSIRLVRILVGTAAFAAAWYAWLNLAPDLDGVLIVVPYLAIAAFGGALIGSRWAAVIVPALGLLPVALHALTTPEPENVRPSEFPAWFGLFTVCVILTVLCLVAWTGFVIERLVAALIARASVQRLDRSRTAEHAGYASSLDDVGHEVRLVLGAFAVSVSATIVSFLLLTYVSQLIAVVTQTE